MIYGKSCVLQILLRVAADPTLTEDALVDLLMDVLADETHQPPHPRPSREKSGESMSGASARTRCSCFMAYGPLGDPIFDACMCRAY